MYIHMWLLFNVYVLTARISEVLIISKCVHTILRECLFFFGQSDRKSSSELTRFSTCSYLSGAPPLPLPLSPTTRSDMHRTLATGFYALRGELLLVAPRAAAQTVSARVSVCVSVIV